MTLAAEIHADEQRYRLNCRTYGEPLQFRPDVSENLQPDLYGPHAQTLEARATASEKQTLAVKLH